MKININLDYIKKELLSDGYNEVSAKANTIYNELSKNKNETNEYLGWMNYFESNKIDLSKINKIGNKIKKENNVLLVVGIGGSYLGAKAAIDIKKKYFIKEELEIIFVGHNLCEDYYKELIEYLNDKDFSINVISKSGTTTEPAIAFRIFKNLLMDKYKDTFKDRIYITTDKEKGALVEFAKKNDLDYFVIPNNIGGRFSVLTEVGLLPMVCGNLSISDVIDGAKKCAADFEEDKKMMDYAIIRNILYKKGFNVEVFVSYEERLRYFSEWFKQLFGESEGKEGKGIFVSSVINTTDLHSMGQFIQEGTKNLFETVIKINKVNSDIIVKKEQDNLDNLNYLENKSISMINNVALSATQEAHAAGDIPNITIEIDELNDFTLGYMFYFFEMSCAISAMLIDVNPFDQPGVEMYKTSMFKKLNKPGY